MSLYPLRVKAHLGGSTGTGGESPPSANQHQRNLLTCIFHTFLPLSDRSSCAILHKAKPQSLADDTEEISHLLCSHSFDLFVPAVPGAVPPYMDEHSNGGIEWTVITSSGMLPPVSTRWNWFGTNKCCWRAVKPKEKPNHKITGAWLLSQSQLSASTYDVRSVSKVSQHLCPCEEQTSRCTETPGRDPCRVNNGRGAWHHTQWEKTHSCWFYNLFPPSLLC